MKDQDMEYRKNLSRLLNIILIHYIASNFSGICATIINLTGRTISSEEADICFKHLLENKPSESKFPEFIHEIKVGSYWFEIESPFNPRDTHIRSHYLRALIYELDKHTFQEESPEKPKLSFIQRIINLFFKKH